LTVVVSAVSSIVSAVFSSEVLAHEARNATANTIIVTVDDFIISMIL
jgi:hypothetical protein